MANRWCGNAKYLYQSSEDLPRAIFDVSGGDIANEVLPYLDFDTIRKANKPYFGYSDLTTVINSLYTKAGVSSYLYQVRFLVGKYAGMQQTAFYNS